MKKSISNIIIMLIMFFLGMFAFMYLIEPSQRFNGNLTFDSRWSRGDLKEKCIIHWQQINDTSWQGKRIICIDYLKTKTSLGQ